jgi:hypothetical protein
MHATNVLKLFEVGRRGRPVTTIGPGDLAEPYSKGPWQKAVSLWKAIVEIARESRELESRLMSQNQYRRLGDY